MDHTIAVKGYQIIKKIDQQGLRIIYKAISLQNNIPVYLTVIPVKSEHSLELLKKRASQAKLLRHPNLASIINYGVLPDQEFFYATEAIPSVPLRDFLAMFSLKWEYWFVLAKYFMDLLHALSYIHAAKTTHRDLTTHHLRITSNQKLIIEGFINPRPKSEPRNVANLVHFPYMSPEQLSGASADNKTDIYSLGVIFFELITGHLPYESNYVKLDYTNRGVFPKITDYRLDVPEEIQSMVLRALSAREYRYANVESWLLDMESFYQQRSLFMKLKDLSLSVKNLFSFAS